MVLVMFVGMILVLLRVSDLGTLAANIPEGGNFDGLTKGKAAAGVTFGIIEFVGLVITWLLCIVAFVQGVAMNGAM